MKGEMPNVLVAQFGEFIAAQMGLHFPPDRWPDLRRGIRNAAPEFGFEDPEPCVRWLMSAPLTRHQIEILAGVLTVGETYFFREKRVFEILADRLMPELLQSRRGGDQHVRLWSAACCTGEEAYSLAITLRRAIPDFADWRVTILATDVNPRFLRKAAAGEFGEWSFRDAPPWLKAQYFHGDAAGRYTILPEIRQMVHFEQLNLAEDSYPSLLTDTNAMDVILCRNVLMYFVPAQARRVIARLHSCLVDGGLLALSATETAVPMPPEFTAFDAEGTMLYRKASQPPVPTAAGGAAAMEGPAPAAAVEEPCAEPLATTREMIRMTREWANRGRLSEALTMADELVQAEKLNPVAHYLRAMILVEQGATPEAARALRRALYIKHDFVIAHFALGNLARDLGRRKESDKHFANALHWLEGLRQDDILPESEGMTAGRLAEIITSVREAAVSS